MAESSQELRVALGLAFIQQQPGTIFAYNQGTAAQTVRSARQQRIDSYFTGPSASDLILFLET